MKTTFTFYEITNAIYKIKYQLIQRRCTINACMYDFINRDKKRFLIQRIDIMSNIFYSICEFFDVNEFDMYDVLHVDLIS